MPKSFLVVGATVFVMQMIGCLLISEPTAENVAAQETSVINKNYDGQEDEEVESQSIAKNRVEEDINSLGVR